MTDHSTVSEGTKQPQRMVVLMCDGLGSTHHAESAMPTLKAWADGGISVNVKAVLPTVTNANNASICCGTWPSVHGVVGNSFLDDVTGQEEYLERFVPRLAR